MCAMEQNKENTKKFQIRIWYLTIFDDELKHPENVIYDLSWKQMSKNKREFYHQILIFNTIMSIGQIRKIYYPTAQIEKKKSATKMANKVKLNANNKRTNIVEIGKLPSEEEIENINKNENKNENKNIAKPKEKLKTVKKNKNKNEKENKISESKEKLITVAELKNISNPKRLYFDEYDVWLKIHSDMNCRFNIDEIHKNVEVYYIFGPSGVGKTKKAYEIINEHKSKIEKFNRVSYNNYCWDGIEGNCRIALYDDFVDDDITPIEFKHFIDHDKQLLNTQNGYMKNSYRLIVITSTQNPQDLFKDSKVDKNQWLSRITKIIDLTPKETN